MLAELDLGPLGTLAMVFAIVITVLVIKANRGQNRQPNLRRSSRPPQMPRYAPPPAPQPKPLHIGESAEAEDVARQLAPEFLETAHAPTLVRPEEEPVAEKSWLNLRDPNEVRRAFILKEVLARPRALRR